MDRKIGTSHLTRVTKVAFHFPKMAKKFKKVPQLVINIRNKKSVIWLHFMPFFVPKNGQNFGKVPQLAINILAYCSRLTPLKHKILSSRL